MSGAPGRRPPAPVRRPPVRGRRPEALAPEGPDERREPPAVLRLPQTAAAVPQAAAAPPPRAEATDPSLARPPAREGRATRSTSPPASSRRSRWRLGWGAVWVSLGVVLLLVGVGWALLVSSLTELQRVDVQGAERTGGAAVQQAAAPELGRPLLRVDAGGVSDRVQEMPWVQSVQVERRFPHRLEVTVVERTPVAAVAAADGAAGVVLLDGDGREITGADAPPDGVPLVQVDVASAGGGAVRAASAVALALPPQLREQVTGVTALGRDDVRLALRSGQEVRWGGPGDDALKARVALLLLARDGVSRVDVSAPTAPATS